jgi:PAS domain S-box-containing protein
MPDIINVLIVEDRQDDADIIVIELESDGFKVSWQRVETPEDFLSHLTPNIDVILADYTLPRFSAPHALTLLQERGFDTPFIVVTGSVSEEAAVLCMKQGAADYLLKDRLSRLCEAVRHAIMQRDLRRIQRKIEQDLIVLGRAVETSINAVVMTDLEGSITFVNRAVLDLWGISNRELILGKSLETLLQSPEESQLILNNLKQERTAKGEFHILSSDGKPITLHYAASEVTDLTDKPICWMSTFIDVTEQKKAEILHVELERERELRDLKSHFISMLVHDFRNPLTALQLGLVLIDKYPERFTMQQVHDKVHSALEHSERINHLIDDVLMIGQMENVSIRFAPEQVEFVDFCRSVFNEFTQSVDGVKHRFVFKDHVTSLLYAVDTGLLRRAITNLLSNAVKYSPEGGKVKLSLSMDNLWIVIRVSDEGIGIPEGDRKRLFDGFHRASNVGGIEGTGLGLAIVKQVVDMHKGRIECESEVDQGTTFIVKLPL